MLRYLDVNLISKQGRIKGRLGKVPKAYECQKEEKGPTKHKTKEIEPYFFAL